MLKNDLAYIITGAPGSGKTLLKKALFEKGIKGFEEPARAIIAEQRCIGGQGIYDRDTALFKELILSRAISQYQRAVKENQIIIFDRGIPDIIAYAKCFNLPAGAEQSASEYYRYNQTVFFAPSWKAIYRNDEERKLRFEQSEEFGDNLKQVYQRQGYKIVELPCVTPEQRADFVLAHIEGNRL